MANNKYYKNRRIFDEDDDDDDDDDNEQLPLFGPPYRSPFKNIYQNQYRHVEYHHPCQYYVIRDVVANQTWLAIKLNDFILQANILPIINLHLKHSHQGQLNLASGSFTKENLFDLSFWMTERHLKIRFLTIHEYDEALIKHPVLNFEYQAVIKYEADFVVLATNQIKSNQIKYQLSSNQNVMTNVIGIVDPNQYQVQPDSVYFRFIDDNSLIQKLFRIKIFDFNNKYYPKIMNTLVAFANATQDENIIQACQILAQLPIASLDRRRFDYLWKLFNNYFNLKKTFQIELVRRQYRQGVNYWLNQQSKNNYLKIQPFKQFNPENLDWNQIKEKLKSETKRDQTSVSKQQDHQLDEHDFD